MTRFFLTLSFLLGFTCMAFAEFRAIPYLSGPVLDEARMLSSFDESRLEGEIRSYMPLVQMQLWIVDNLEGEPIESLSIRAVDQWKLGEKSKDNGVLILIAQKDRRVRIEVGRGLEGNITDLTSNRIIREILTPQFRSGNSYDGISMAAAAIYQRAGGTPSRTVELEKKKSPLPINFIFILIMVALYIGLSIFPQIIFGRTGGRWMRSGRGGFGGGSSWGGSSWGGRGGGGGGGWGGGGGGFSGGGSSGSW